MQNAAEQYVVIVKLVKIKNAPLATARAAWCIDAVHLLVCLSVANMQKSKKRDFLKN